MKTSILVLCSTFLCSICFAQLPPVAQALYNETYSYNVSQGQYATTNSVQVLPTADGNSFYLKWFPSSVTTPSSAPLIVTLHGSGSTAFAEFSAWHTKAQAKGCGIIALQFYRGNAAVPPNDYFDDPVLYSYIDTALKRIHYPSNKALFHGFSRGSARSYAMAYYDRPAIGGKNYFCTIMSNAGGPDSSYALYNQINSGSNHFLFANKCWAMFSGGLDTNKGSKPQAMISAKNWVQANGGSVGLFIYDATKGHGGFHLTPAYIDSLLNFYQKCYLTSGISNVSAKNNDFEIYPNPAQAAIHLTLPNSDKKTLAVYTVTGVLVKSIQVEDREMQVDISDLAKGYYLITYNGLSKTLIRE